ARILASIVVLPVTLPILQSSAAQSAYPAVQLRGITTSPFPPNLGGMRKWIGKLYTGSFTKTPRYVDDRSCNRLEGKATRFSPRHTRRNGKALRLAMSMSAA